jgi:4-hydroxyphenylpyruvate dioxygenase
MSKIVQGGAGKVKVPIIEPATGEKKSQVDEFLDFYGSPGVQHIGLRTSDIVASVDAMKACGVRFLEIPDEYYTSLPGFVPELDDALEDLRRSSVLVDRDEDGYLLQAFTQPMQDRPTFFLELIERHGSQGFGAGNVRNLFAALERAQAARGNL